MSNYLPLIIGMGLATYIPRLIPLIFLSKKELNPKVKQFLQYIPYTSLSILIVRGILTSSQDMMLPTFVGIALAGLISYFKSNLVLSVLVGIIASFMIINII
jgi:branched-subunit amino acid transport protein